VGVIDRVHRYTAYGRTDAAPADRAGFAKLTQIVFAITDFAQSGATLNVDAPNLPGA
jgi:hypothetical protein